ncbi:DUF6464 family protein [Oscillatoria sp. CS-180]|uniref:DUF6464 family protein n=1 Tax=Oscillatoria sp. CS-180 TaxID=3021720 RepID=UPI002330FE45|nr:DUF6464 family protein [Oscillatoria sp. CS-180]MDB9525716.1 DUF6464 family protein [Oscillatoria sp. CS-180]
MLIVLLIFGLSLVPALISAWISLRAQDRVQAEFGRAIEVASQRGLKAAIQRDRDLNYIEGLGYVIGDFSCQMNARSPYLRCAMNPCGPCEGCQFYEPPVIKEVVMAVPETASACPIPPMPATCPLPAFSAATTFSAS